MAWLWLHAPHFAVTAACCQRGLQSVAPLIVADAGRVRDCAVSPWARGVRPGQTLREAQTRCPQAQVVAWDETGTAALWRSLGQALHRLSPEVETQPWQAYRLTTATQPDAVLETAQQAMEAARGLQAPLQGGWSLGRFVSSVAARQADPGDACMIAPGHERAFLAPLPLSYLPLSPETLDELTVLGLRTLADFSGLPSAAVGVRFGSAGLDAWRLARGEERPLPVTPEIEQRPLAQRAVFDPALEWDATLVQALEQALARLGKQLEARGLACQEVGLQVSSDPGISWRAASRPEAPAGSAGALVALAPALLHEVGRVLGDGQGVILPRIAELRLWARELGPQKGEQLALFPEPSRPGQGWSQAVLEIAASYPDCFWRGRRLDPQARLPVQRSAWRHWLDEEET